MTTGFVGMKAARGGSRGGCVQIVTDAKQWAAASDSPQGGPERPLDDVGKVKPKLSW